MSELIDRQSALDALEEGFKDVTKGVDKLSPTYGLTKAVTGIYKCLIGKLPSAQPKRGKWILDRSGAYCCSECMEPCATYVMMQPRDKFCKMCGAKMEVTT